MGIDGRFRIDDTHSIRFQYLNTETSYPESIVTDFGQPEGSFGGNARRLNYGYDTRDWYGNVNYESLDSGFRADLGFINQVDKKRYNANFGHIWHGEEDDWWNQFRLGTGAGRTYDGGGQLLGSFREIFTRLQGPLQSFVNLGVSRGEQIWDGVVYDSRDIFMFGQVRPASGLSFDFQLSRGHQVDFAISRQGKQTNISPGVQWNINRHLLLRLDHTQRELETLGGDPVFSAQLNDLRLTWQFNLRSFLRLSMQHQSIERNLAVYVDPTDVEASSESLGAQLLYSYKLNPRTVFFAGYADNRLENSEFIDRTTTDRTVFVKLSYAWMP
jgi:hypothetical protein